MLSSLLSSNEKCLGTIIDLLIYSFEINPFFLRNIIKLVNTNIFILGKTPFAADSRLFRF